MRRTPLVTRRRIAVVGSGVAGLTSAYVLQREADVTLYEADDRLGGHADTHDVLGARRRAAQHRHRLHRAQPAHLPEPATTVRRARRRDAGVRHEHVDPLRGLRARVRRRPRPLRAAADMAHRRTRATCACSSTSSASTAAPTSAGPDEQDVTIRRDSCQRHRFSTYFVDPLHDPADRRRLVHGAPPGRQLPGALPVHVPGQPRDAAGHRHPGLAHRHARLGPLRREGRARASPPCRPPPRCGP